MKTWRHFIWYAIIAVMFIAICAPLTSAEEPVVEGVDSTGLVEISDENSTMEEAVVEGEIESVVFDAAAGGSVNYVYCGGGVAKKQTSMMVQTSAGVTHVKMNVGEEKVIWSKDDAEVTDYGNYMEWEIKYVFEWSGNYNLSYQASCDGENWGEEYVGDKVAIKDADILYVYCAGGVAEKLTSIVVNTNSTITSLKINYGEEEVIYKETDEGVTVKDYETYKVWTVKHVFKWSGNYGLCYQGSADGESWNEEYWAEPIAIKDADVLYVFCKGGVAKKLTSIVVHTNPTITNLKIRSDKTEVIYKDTDEGVTVDDYGTYKVWTVKHVFEWSGNYGLCYQGSADGETWNEEYWADPIVIKDADVLYVYCAGGIAKKLTSIVVNTNPAITNLKIRSDKTEVIYKDTDEGVTVDDYGTYKVWTVKHVFEWSGTYGLCYQGSADGETWNEEYWADPIDIKDAAILYVYSAGGIKNSETKFSIDTNSTITSVKMKIGDREVIWNENDENVSVDVYPTYKTWHVKHVFDWTGEYGLCYQGSTDGATWSEEYWADTITIKEPAIISVSYSADTAKVDEVLTIYVTTNNDMQFLNVYDGDNIVMELKAADAEIVEKDDGKEWVISYSFETAGEHYMKYEASVDGETFEPSYNETEPIVITEADEVVLEWVSLEQTGEGIVTLKWNAVEGADGYLALVTVEESEEDIVFFFENSEITEGVAAGLSAGVTYRIQIKAYVNDEDGTVADYIAESEVRSIAIEEYKLTVGDFEYEYTEDNTGIVITKYSGTDADVTVPESIEDLPVVEIGDSAFEGNSYLECIDLPDTVAVIGVRAFANCTNLSEMN